MRENHKFAPRRFQAPLASGVAAVGVAVAAVGVAFSVAAMQNFYTHMALDGHRTYAC